MPNDVLLEAALVSTNTGADAKETAVPLNERFWSYMKHFADHVAMNLPLRKEYVFVTIVRVSFVVFMLLQFPHYLGIENWTIRSSVKDGPYTVADSLIFDKTVAWDPFVDRKWLNPKLRNDTILGDGTIQTRPPAMIVLTNYGWNQMNQTLALEFFSRGIYETELLDGIVNHPWFHPTAWELVNDGSSNLSDIVGGDEYLATARFYIFFDQSSCYNHHYPIYGGYEDNLDTTGGRIQMQRGVNWDPVPMLTHPLWESKFIQQIKDVQQYVKLIFFDCRAENAEGDDHFSEKRITHGVPVVRVSESTLITRVDESLDLGLVPPLLHKFNLSEQRIREIQTCDAENETNRPYYLTYIGNFRAGHHPNISQARFGFHTINDGERIIGLNPYWEDFNQTKVYNVSYGEILARSIFSGAPRGDNKYSYRFTEVLAAGAIPVVLADDWVMPFRPELVNWDDCVVFIPEVDAGAKMVPYLDNINVEQRCAMRQKCYEIYEQYVSTPRGTIRGIIDGLELVAQGYHSKMNGVHCNASEPDSDTCNLQRRNI